MAWARIKKSGVIKAVPGYLKRVIISWGGAAAATAGQQVLIYDNATVPGGSETPILDFVIPSTHGTQEIPLRSGDYDQGYQCSEGISAALGAADNVIRLVAEYT